MDKSLDSRQALAVAREIRNAALDRAQHERALRTREANIEYSETVAKLREQFETNLADAASRHRAAVRPVHTAFNAAIIAAEDVYAVAVRDELSRDADGDVAPSLSGADIVTV